MLMLGVLSQNYIYTDMSRAKGWVTSVNFRGLRPARIADRLYLTKSTG